MYRVEWLPVAASELLALYSGASEAAQAELSAAFDGVVAALSASPHTAGEGREPPTRVLFVSPLTVYFRADFRGRVAAVIGVARFRQQGDA